MNLISFRADGQNRWGVIDGESVYDLTNVFGADVKTLRDAIARDVIGQAESKKASAPRFALKDTTALPVIPDPGKIFCIGLNYLSHRLETGRDATSNPTVFTRFADSQIANGANIVRPKVSTALDYEGELAVIIGKPGRYIPRDKAMDHVAGYACYNDVSVRDWQNHTTQFIPGKNFPATGPFGPSFVTAAYIADYTTMKLETRVNGEVVQSAGLDQLIYPIPQLIEYCSSFSPLASGDVIVTGTPGGVGFKRTPPLFLKPGDIVEVEISSVGLLRNPVVDEVA